MTIPYNEAGQRAFEVFCKIAKRLYAEAQAAVDDFARTNCPGSRTLWERHENGQYQRAVAFADKNSIIRYDYEQKTIEMA